VGSWRIPCRARCIISDFSVSASTIYFDIANPPIEKINRKLYFFTFLSGVWTISQEETFCENLKKTNFLDAKS
jgi:hypothetical protein